MGKAKDGWYKIYDTDIYVEDGKVLRGIRDGRTVYPYRCAKSGGWDNVSGVKLETLRQGIRHRNYRMI